MKSDISYHVERREKGGSQWTFYAAPKDATEEQARKCATAWNFLFSEWRFRAIKVTTIREVLKELVQP